MLTIKHFNKKLFKKSKNLKIFKIIFLQLVVHNKKVTCYFSFPPVTLIYYLGMSQNLSHFAILSVIYIYHNLLVHTLSHFIFSYFTLPYFPCHILICHTLHYFPKFHIVTLPLSRYNLPHFHHFTIPSPLFLEYVHRCAWQLLSLKWGHSSRQ